MSKRAIIIAIMLLALSIGVLLYGVLGPTEANATRTNELGFRNPWYLLVGLTAIPLFLLSFQGRGYVVFSSLNALPEKRASWRETLYWLPDALLALSFIALSVALAGPRVLTNYRGDPRQGIAMVMALDTSSSMILRDPPRGSQPSRTMGCPPQVKNWAPRIDVVRSVFREFINGGKSLTGRPNDAIGLVSFARFADTRSPTTLDRARLTEIVDNLGTVPRDSNEDGTAVGEGLALAIDLLERAEAKSRVVILLTDGRSNAGDVSPIQAADLAAKYNIKVYTIGAGGDGEAWIHGLDHADLPDDRCAPVQSQPDEETLQDIAKRTNGKFFRASDIAGLRKVYQEIDTLERSKLAPPRSTDFRYHHNTALGFGLLLALLSVLANRTLWRRLP